MEYTIQKLAKLAGVTARTLRFYDEIGLLVPKRQSSSGYRIYGQEEIDRLQQILFFREMGLELQTIRETIDSEEFDQTAALHNHLHELLARRHQLNLLIKNVKKTIFEKEGGDKMSDKEKFTGFKEKLISDNERKFGNEIRKQYGDKTIDASNAKMMNLSEEEYHEMNDLSESIIVQLEHAVSAGEKPESETGAEIARMHKQWLCFHWDSYSPQAHKGLVQMYLDDERFQQYYDKNVAGCAQFLAEAVRSHL